MKTPLAPELKPNATPSHEEVSQSAHDLWWESHCPEGRDEEIWLEAERRLTTARHQPSVSEFIEITLCRPDRS